MSENVYLINVILHDLLKGIWTDESIKAFNVVEKKLNELDSLHHAYNELNSQNEEIIKENERLKKNYNLLDSTIEIDDRTIFELLQENKDLKEKNDYLKFLIKKYFVYDSRNHIIKKSVYNFDYESIKDVLNDE